MLTLFLVRHGESTWNAIGRYQGQMDPPLSPRGERQAATAAEALRFTPFDAAVSSPLQRAYQTAVAIAAPHNLPVGRDARLTEIGHGAWEGLPVAEVIAGWPELTAMWKQDPTDVQMPDGEHFGEVVARTRAWLADAQHQYDGQTLLAASHDVILRILLADAQGLPLTRIWDFRLDNAAISEVQYTGGTPSVIHLNDTAHLADLVSDVAKQAL
jgi:broad specificity phosphatase PhoE